MNNFYGMGGQPVGETMGFGILAGWARGLTPDRWHAERVDGYNPLAVIEAIARKREIIQKGDGPVLQDTLTYRFSGHSPSDASSYRERTELEGGSSGFHHHLRRWSLRRTACAQPTSMPGAGRSRGAHPESLQEGQRIWISLPARTSTASDRCWRRTMYTNGKVESFESGARAGSAHCEGGQPSL